ncbi:type 2 periplasmic-binding domain-containing protein [Mycoplasma ovis]|uniref:hypothetical protein n=1 Tax=Mycoplasma ovis TaxID=171632 RepID=UPI002E0F5151
MSDKLGKLYSPVVSKFFKNSPQLAEYGVPYFISYFAFAYRGKKEWGENGSLTTASTTSSDSSSTSTTQKPMSWNELIEKISKDSRFKSDDKPKLGMVEDELTLFSLSKLSSKNDSSQIEKLFEKEIKQSEDDFYNQYMKINEAGINKTGLGERPLFFSPDSVVLSEELSSGDLEGIFFYNGDALYAHQLLKEEKSKNTEETTSQEIHIVPLSPALWFLDSIVISSKSSPSKEARIYEFLEKLSFKNFDKLSELDRQEELGGDSEDKEEGDKERPQWLLGNFMEIGYTPVLQDFNKWIKGEKPPKSPPEPPEGEGDFYKKEKEFLYGNPDIEKCLAQQPPNNGQQCSIVFEGGLNDSQNLNLALAFERWKNNF